MVTSRLLRYLFLALGCSIAADTLSSAQTNISVVIPAGNSLLCNPLDNTNGNSADKIFALSPLGSTYAQPPGTMNSFYVLTWNGISYNTVYYENDFTAANTYGAVTNGWATDGSGTIPATPPTLNPGVAFFISNAGNSVTNTFFGNVTPSRGQTNTLIIPAGTSPIASRLPVSGLLTSPAFQFPIAPVCLGCPPPQGTLDSFCVLTWNGSAFDSFCYSSDFGSQGTTPTIGVGEGFFVNNSGGVADWSQTQP